MAYQLEGIRFEGNHATEVDEAEAIRCFHEGKELLWIHIESGNHVETHKFITETFGFHPLEVEDALSPEERPTLNISGDQIFLVATAVKCTGEQEEYVEVAFFVCENSIVTISREPLPGIELWRRQFLSRSATHSREPSHILHAILDAIVDGYFPVTDKISDAIEELEDQIFENHKVSMEDAIHLKRRLLYLRRNITPIRDVLNSLLRHDVQAYFGDSNIYFQDVFDHSLRIVESVDMERDILTGVMDAYLSVTSNNLNQVMKKMTVISTVLMTAAFIAGVYGMNFEVMPELKWANGYGFAWGLMAAVATIEIIIFRKLGWF